MMLCNQVLTFVRKSLLCITANIWDTETLAKENNESFICYYD